MYKNTNVNIKKTNYMTIITTIIVIINQAASPGHFWSAGHRAGKNITANQKLVGQKSSCSHFCLTVPQRFEHSEFAISESIIVGPHILSEFCQTQNR